MAIKNTIFVDSLEPIEVPGASSESRVSLGESLPAPLDLPEAVKHTPISVDSDEPLLRLRDSRLSEIKAKIEDSSVSQVELARLIAAEMASILERMNLHMADPSRCLLEGASIKNLGEQLKGMRELGKQLMETETLAKRDYINFDGAKFTFIAGAWIDIAKEALRDMGLDQNMVTSFVKHYRDKLAMAEPKLRREAEEVGSTSK